ncbi:Hypothetical protein CpOVID04_1407 [Corynebacterium pseudotuberculosis]|nr:Hypothetical protein CpCAP1R_1390 [Corynebacterium pseudotuberculosis]QBK60804.1 Hypothetical protein CpE7_1406 [Corynebacterium pseudotuberculosis]QBS29660.1 Hypothetical protein CpCAP1C_1403 [Corynebacterium pseudotuberculosis]QCG72864.1 Hypothetical protein CpOVI1FL_1391 [Corynebacterium pseudotuberculosis]QDL41225.1 Hypothetical protein CpOVID04_1407 [Corynebacterium pseudotuberculosis]
MKTQRRPVKAIADGLPATGSEHKELSMTLARLATSFIL